MLKGTVFAAAVILAAVSTPALAENAPAAGVSVSPGKQIYDAAGRRIGATYRVTSEGNPQIIVDGKLVTIPASTLSETNGKIQSSLNKSDLSHLK